MKYCREYILEKAFEVFMQRGYDSASISVLQTELNMSRGAMYRYFKNKEELFITVIDEYFFKQFDRYLHRLGDHDYSLKEYIEITHRRQKLLVGVFIRAGITHSFFLDYTALLIQAVKYYPHFIVRFRQLNQVLISCWKKALINSIHRNEIKPDIDVNIMGILFHNTRFKESSGHDCSCDEELFNINIVQDLDKRKQIIDYLYSLIKC